MNGFTNCVCVYVCVCVCIHTVCVRWLQDGQTISIAAGRDVDKVCDAFRLILPVFENG